MRISYTCLLAILPLVVRGSSQDTISTYAGGGPNNVPATAANIASVANTAVDKAGNFYIVSYDLERVFKVNTSGTLTVFAGNGLGGYAGDGGPATQAEMDTPEAAAVDSSGNVYIADTNNCVIRKVTASTGNTSTYAGNGTCGYSGDGGAATSAEFHFPTGVALDSSGNLYIPDMFNERIRKVTASTGKVSTIAGNGMAGFSGDGGPATSAALNTPQSVAVDSSGNVYIADQSNYRIRKVTASTGKISTIAGNGTDGYSGDGGPATSAEISAVFGIAVDSSGNVFIADTKVNCVVREVNTSGIIKTVAGTPQACGYSGDGGPATSAELDFPQGVAVYTAASAEYLYIADDGNLRVRKAVLGGDIDTAAGNGTVTYTAGVTATQASLDSPAHVTSDSSGNRYIADTGNCIIRKVTAAGDISTIAGLPTNCGFSGDGGPATRAQLDSPTKAKTDSAGNVYIVDPNRCDVRKVTASTGNISTSAGGGGCGYGGDGGAATSAKLLGPSGLALDASGNLYIADTDNNVVREVVAATGKITTVAGNFAKGAGYSGDGGPATTAQLSLPEDVAVDGAGHLYIGDTYNNRVRVVNPTGIINTFAGDGTTTFHGDGGPANKAGLNFVVGVAVDVAGDVLITDTDNNRIRWVDGQGIIYTVAGDGTFGYSGDGGLATKAEIAEPNGVGVDPSGNIYIADTFNFRVRQVTAIANLNSSAYNLTFPAQKVGTASKAQSITLKGVGPLTVDSISTTGDFTETNDCPSSLTSGSKCTANITFKPSAVGTRTGTLAISTNGFFNPNITVNLTGTGEN